MEYKPPIRNHRKRNLLIATASVLLIAAVAATTFYALKQVVKMDKPNASTATSTPAEDNRQKADKLLTAGDLQGAKDAYQKALSDYEAAKDQAGVADMNMQIAIITKMQQAPSAPQNTDKTRVTVGSKSQ